MLFSFQDYELDKERRELRKHSQLIAIPPKAFSVLVYLIEHSSRMVSKTELLENFWPANVGDAALQTTISLLRKSLGDSRSSQTIIKTYHGQGVRFVATLDDTKQAAHDQDNIQPPRILREQRLTSVMCMSICSKPDERSLSPPQRAALEKCYLTAEKTVQKYQGTLLHMMLNGFTAVFGSEQTHEDCARRAVYCASELSKSSEVGTLINCGLQPAFSIETGSLNLEDNIDRNHWTLPSDIERLAISRAETASGGDILLGTKTAAHLGDEINVEVTSKAIRLVEVSQQRTGIPSKPEFAKSKFVGRTAELAFLNAGISDLADGRGYAAVISGSPGIGKSRLIAEFLSQLDDDISNRLTVNCLPSLQNTPLAAIQSMCSELFSDMPTDAINDPVDAAVLKAILNSAEPPDPLLIGLSDHQRKRVSEALINRLLQIAGDGTGLVIVFEDIHWIDASSREFLEAILQSIDENRAFIVMTTRPVEQPLLTEKIVQLSPLSRNESVSLLSAIPNLGNLDNQKLDMLTERAGGIPFFLEELALSAISGTNPANELPQTVQAVISGRISGLEDELRSLLYVIAVIGSPARIQLAVQLLGLSLDVVDTHADQLINKGFLRKDDAGFSVRHMLISETAYELVALEDRKRLHLEIALCMEENSEQDHYSPESLAWHFQEAGKATKAITYWIEACRSALRRSAHNEALVFAENGLELVHAGNQDTPELELQLQLSLAFSLTALSGYGAGDVGKAYFRASELNKAVRSGPAHFQVSIGLWLHNWVLGELSKSFFHAQQLLNMAKGSENQALKAQAHSSAGEILIHTGKLNEGFEHLKAGTNLIIKNKPDTVPTQNAAVACAAYAGWAASLTGKSIDEVNLYMDAANEIRSLIDNPFAAAIHYGLCSEIHMFEGHVEQCLGMATKAVAISREHNFPFWLGTGLVMRGWALGQMGSTTDAIVELEEGISVFESTGAGIQLVNWYGLHAETLFRAKRYQDGLTAANTALKQAQKTNDLFFTPRVHAVAAAIHDRIGNSAKSAFHSDEAENLIATFGMKREMIVFTAD